MKRLLLFLALLLPLCAPAGAAPPGQSGSQDWPQVFPFRDIKPGMTGTGKTVFKGETIETFQFTVIDALRGMGPSGGDLILFRGASENFKKNHGVSQGMSGSPVYIQGKLAGAVSLAFAQGDPLVGGATPIEEMLGALSASINKKPVSTSFVIPGYGKAVLAQSPVFVAGGSPRATRLLEQELSAQGQPVRVLAAAPAAADEELRVLEETPQPGGMIVVGMLQGDVSVFTAGTLTAVVGDRVLAFGHSFRRVGPVELGLGKGAVSHVMENREVSYKVVKPVGLYGRMDEDRGVAMVGTLMRFPETASIFVSTRDTTLGKQHEGRFRAVTDNKFSLEVTRTALLSALDKTLDRIGKGTSQVSFSIKLKEREKPIVRANTFYNPVDIAAESIREADGLLKFFQFNEFEEVTVQELSFSATISDAENAMAVRKVALKHSGQRGGGLLQTGGDGDKKVILKKRVGGAGKEKGKDAKNHPQKGGGKNTQEEPGKEDPKGDDPDGEDEDEARAKAQRKADDDNPPPKPGQDPHLTIRPGQSVTVDVTLLPFRQKPVQKSFRIQLHRKSWPAGDYNFTVGGFEPPGEGDEDQKEDPLSFDEALKELDTLSPNDELILECKSIVVRDQGHKNGKEPDKKALRQVIKVPGWAVGGKKNFRITVKAPEPPKTSNNPPKAAPQKSAPRKSRLDPPKER